MISYFTKQYQAVPALMQLNMRLPGKFVSTRSSTINALKKVYPEAVTIKYTEKLGKFSAGYRALEKSKAIVTGSPNKNLLYIFNAKKYMVFHGTYALMAKDEIEGLSHFDHLCVIGPRMSETLQNSGYESKMLMTGYLPFLEFPQRDALSRLQLLEAMCLDPGKQTLIYLPMGRPFSSWDLMAEKLIIEVPKKYNLILRPHPSQSVTARLHDKLNFLRIKQLCRQRGNAILDLSSYKLSQLYAIADAVISDGASCPEESMYYDLPQIFVETDRYSRHIIKQVASSKNLSTSYIEKLLDIYNCGISITPVSPNLPRILDEIIEKSDAFRANRLSYFTWVFGSKNPMGVEQLINQLKSSQAGQPTTN